MRDASGGLPRRWSCATTTARPSADAAAVASGAMDWGSAVTAFVVVFPAELPDKTMVATLVLTTRYRRPLAVWCGAVSAFAIRKDTGLLTALNQSSSGGPGPAHLSLDEDGKTALVANYGGGSIAVLPLAADGRLEGPAQFIQHAGSSVNPDRQKEPHAHHILTDPSNRFVYVTDLGIDKIMIYRFDAATRSRRTRAGWVFRSSISTPRRRRSRSRSSGTPSTRASYVRGRP